MNVMGQLLDSEEFENLIVKMSKQLSIEIEQSDSPVFIGMATRGVPLAGQLAEKLSNIWAKEIEVGALDNTFYRDDFHYRNKLAEPTMAPKGAPVNIDGKNVVLVDDVLFTGRSTRAALEALKDMGRPASVKLVVLVDRQGRELPIQADFVGLSLSQSKSMEVKVSVSPIDEENRVDLIKVEGE
jgi:pyrimidine operon attenuation protein / uracil phosphoribosyltransferase